MDERASQSEQSEQSQKVEEGTIPPRVVRPSTEREVVEQKVIQPDEGKGMVPPIVVRFPPPLPPPPPPPPKKK